MASTLRSGAIHSLRQGLPSRKGRSVPPTALFAPLSPISTALQLFPTPRLSSSSSAKKPILLDKPTKFVPPSHPSRIVSKKNSLPRHYEAPMTEDQHAERKRKQYPTMMAPEGTWAHWFWTSRTIHVYIAISTLLTLAVTTFTLNFTHTSPFRHLLPENSDLWRDPVHFFRAWAHAISLHEQDRNERAIQARMQRLDDAVKRKQYQKAHGIEPDNPIAKWIGPNELTAEDRRDAMKAAHEAEMLAKGQPK